MKLNYFNCFLITFLLSFMIGMKCYSQGQTVSGTVTGSDGIPIPGVNVLVKGTMKGTITDPDGKYSIVAGETDVIQFSYIGYLTEDITVGAQTEINITLVENMIDLSEVVVVGYGTVKRSDVTGSLSSVTEEEIKAMPVTNINQAIQGKAAGVDVVYNSFGLNSSPKVRIRGNRSIKADNDPLYVVDGIPINGTINDINAMDVVSIEVLKDASATAIYGSRGANGVILVTTKRGKSGQYNVNFESSVSVRNSLRFFNMLTGHEWMEIARDNRRNAGTYDTPYPDPDEDYAILSSMRNTCWESVEMGYEWNADGSVVMRPTTQEEREKWAGFLGVTPDEVPAEVPLYNPDNVRTYDWESEGRNKNALTQNHQFSVSGGSDQLTAYFSLGYINEEGLGIGENYKRISPRLNLDFQPLKWLKVGMSNTFNSELIDKGHGLFWGVTSQLPISLPYDSTGFLINPTDDVMIKNPIRDEELNTKEDRIYRYLGSYFAEISFKNNLKYKLNVSQDFRHLRAGSFEHELSSTRWPSVNAASYSQEQLYHYSVDNLLFYNKELGIHSIGITLLQSIEAKRWEKNKISAQNLPYNTQLWYNMSSTLDPETIELDNNDDFTREQLASFMGRINYSLMDKYLVTASLRYDGASKFYVDNQWDFFPSFAVSWKAHNETFIKSISAISQLKLRFGYGTVGQSGTDPYETQGQITESFYVFGNDPAKGYAPLLIQTKEVGWEKTTTTNIGIDFGILRNRFSGTIELYEANTHDLLLDKKLPSITGYEKVRANVGKTKNRGIEITLNTVNVNTRDFRWETDFIFSKNEEEIVELAEGAEDDILNNWFIGYPIRSYFTYEYDGIWQVKDSALIDHYNETGNNGFAPGKIRVKDTDGNDTINTADRVVVGHNVPKFSGGLTNRIIYKGFELSAFIFFRAGHGIYSRDAHYMTHTARYATPFKVHYYKPAGTEEENASATHPAPSDTRDKYEEALWYQEASFIKVRHITLSYDVPKSLLSKLKIKSLQLSVQAFNPFLITNYDYLDPEAQQDDVNKTPGGTSDKGWTFSVKLGL